MSQTGQILMKTGSVTAANAPTTRRIRIDPGLQDEDGNILEIDEATIIGPAQVVSKGSEVDIDGITHYHFDVEVDLINTFFDQDVQWVAKHNHSIQEGESLAMINSYGTNGANPSPVAPTILFGLPSSDLLSGNFTIPQASNGQAIYGDSTAADYTSLLPAQPIDSSLIRVINNGTANTWYLDGNGNNIENSALPYPVAAGDSFLLHYRAVGGWYVL